MKRVLLFSGLTFLLGLALGLFLHISFPSSAELPSASPALNGLNTIEPVPAASPAKLPEDSAPPASASTSESQALLKRAYAVLDALKAKDYETLASYVHSAGVRFTPYSSVDPASDLVFSAQQIAGAATDTQVYTWGIVDGSGEPLEMTMSDYFARYVFNTDYTEAPRIGLNQVVQSGNALENVAEQYPDCVFVDFNFPGLDPEQNGLDWCSLKLVFQPEQGRLQLVGILHGEWTI